MMIASGKPCHGGNRIFVESLTCIVVILSRAVYLWRIAPVGEGLTGRGEA